MLAYDPLLWLMAQDGPAALRARGRLGLSRLGDAEAVDALVQSLTDGDPVSPIKTAGILNFLADLRAAHASEWTARGAEYLLAVLKSQPGYARAGETVPGGLTAPCDLGGFFGPYQERARPEVMAYGAQEMNHYREFEPLLGPQSPVCPVPRSSLDRAGPGSCYSWGLIPLSYIIEALCRTGHADDARLQPAISVLLGAQRASGGWCRNLGGHPNCTLHAAHALGAHPTLRRSEYADRALRLLLTHNGRLSPFVVLQIASSFDLSPARKLIHNALEEVAPRQHKDGSFGTPHPIERAVAVLAALNALEDL